MSSLKALMAAVLGSSLLSVASAAESGGIPRTVEGRPDFSGVWQVMNTANWDIEPHHARPGTPPGLGIVVDGPLPYKAEALAQRRENWAKRDTGVDVDSKCFLPGVPRIMYEPYPFMIDQTPNMIMMVFEYVNAKRYVYMDSPHMKGPIEWWMGDSRGRWDGDTLVVDVTYLNADPWFDRSGNYHSEELQLVERYAYLTPDHIQYTATVTDPKTFTRPFTISMVLYRHKEPYFQILDNECYAFEDRDIRPNPPRAVRSAK